MGMTIDEKDLKCILKPVVEEIFANKDFKSLSNFQRRQAIFNYLVNHTEYDFDLLNDIYSGKNREYADELVSVFDPGKKKGVCNSFSYAYKTLLDLLNIPCMLVICNVEEDSINSLKAKGVNTNSPMIKRNSAGKYLIPHMMVLVQNADGTFSFDDITYAIFNRGTEKESTFFNYNNQAVKNHNQINLEGFDTDMLRCIVNNSQDTQGDVAIRRKYGQRNNPGFLRIPNELIKRYSDSQIEDVIEIL